jgi:hypothetical protein
MNKIRPKWHSDLAASVALALLVNGGYTASALFTSKSNNAKLQIYDITFEQA